VKSLVVLGDQLIVLCLSVVVGVMLLPAALVILSVLWWLGGGDAAAILRLGLLGLCYALYFAVFGALTLAASAMARTSRGALVAMIGLWGAFCLVAPRVATSAPREVRAIAEAARVSAPKTAK
jgi:ABC-2 type transport system permease protein